MVSKRLERIVRELSEEGLIDLKENETPNDWFRRLSLHAREKIIQEWVNKHKIKR